VTPHAEPGARGPGEPPGLHLWWALCLALALPAVALHVALRTWLPQGSVPLDAPVTHWPPLAQGLVMQPEAGLAQPPWVWWTTVWLHGSLPHLWRNLAGLALVAALGVLVRPSRAAAQAAWLAWPLTQAGMLAQPTLTSYVGLSGVLHASVAVLALHALTMRPDVSPMGPSLGGLRVGGLALLTGLMAKVLMENPWQHALVASTSSAINVAPWAHLSGCVAGLLASGALASSYRLARRCH